jgi:hypothetical protein
MQTAARKFTAFRSVAVEERRESVLPFAVGLGRNVGHRAALFDLPTDRFGIVPVSYRIRALNRAAAAAYRLCR